MAAKMEKTKTPGIFKRGGRYVFSYRVNGGHRVAEGRMVGVSDDRVELQLRDAQTVSIPLADVEAARLAVDL